MARPGQASFIQVVRPEKLKAKPLRCQPPRPSCYLLGTRLGRQLGFAEVAQYWQERDIIDQVGCGRLSASPQVLAAEDQLQTSRIIRRGGYGFSSWCATTVAIVAKYCTAVLQTYLPVWSNLSAPSTAAELLKPFVERGGVVNWISPVDAVVVYSNEVNAKKALDGPFNCLLRATLLKHYEINHNKHSVLQGDR